MAEQYLSKPSPHWIGDPTTTAIEYIALADVLAVNSGTSATNGCITLTLGVAFTGEVFTTDAMLFNSPGIYSVPLPSGTINSDGSFTADNTSAVSAQAVCWVRNDQWTVLSVRDTRTQSNPGNIQAGEIAIYAQGNTNFISLTNDGAITLSNSKTNIIVSNSSIDISNNNIPVNIAGGANTLVPTPFATALVAALTTFANGLNVETLTTQANAFVTALGALPSDATTMTKAT